MPQGGYTRLQRPARGAEDLGVDDQRGDFRILEYGGVIVDRAERMERGHT
jgi:hypothetical protein